MAHNAAQSEGITMSGGGLYSLATIGAKHVIDAATPLVLNAIRELPAERLSNGITITDMGCADAGTSLDMIDTAIGEIRSRSSDAAVSIVYADQPRNDFNALITNVHGLGPFSSWLDKHENVYPMASGTSFYRQITPGNTVDIGFSATAMHWLSNKVCNITNHVQAVGAQGDERQAFSDQASSDWRQILLHRSKELVYGGKLVLINFCTDEQGRYLGNTGGVNMFDNFNRIWRDFLCDGRITQAEYENMTLPQYYNTVEEFSAPFSGEHEAVYQSGLRLDSIETKVVRCPFAADFEEHGDSEKFSRAYIPTIRSWNESIFFNGLSTDRAHDDRVNLIEQYYETYRQQVQNSPKGHGMDYVHAYTVISKVNM